MYGCGKDCLILIPFRLPQISCFTLSLNCFSSDSDSRPSVRIRALLQFPYPLRAGPVLLILLFPPLVPLSYWVLCGSIYSFPLVRSSCSLSAGVLYAFLCLKCIPDVSVERDVLHVHLLLCHLVLPAPYFWWLIFPGGSDSKESTAVLETWVWSLGWEDPLEEGMATHSSIFAWRIPMDRGTWWATVHEVAKRWTRLSN